MKNMTFVCLIDELFRDDGNVQPNNNKGNEYAIKRSLFSYCAKLIIF